MIHSGSKSSILFVSFLFALAIIGLAETALAQTSSGKNSSYLGRVVGEIKVDGHRRIEKDAILEKISHKKGSRLRAKDLRGDIQALYKQGFFDDITVEASEMGGDEVRLTYKVVERPIITQVVYEGNEQVDTEELEEATKVREYTILNIPQLREDVDAIRKHYEDKGFYLAKVDYKVEEGKKPNEVKVIFKIRDFDKVKIKSITFLNNKAFTDDKLRSVMGETSVDSMLSFLSGAGSFKESAFRNDLQRLMLHYLDNGYLKFRFERPVVTVSDDKRWLYISIYVEEGDQYRMGDTAFSGDMLYTDEKLREKLEIKKGDIFKITQRNLEMRNLTELYQDKGFAFVNVIPNMKFDDKKLTVDTDYTFEKGKPVNIGEIRVVGNSKTHDKVIRRELRVYEGELYNGTNMRVSRERVERLGFFAPGEVIFNELTRKGRDDVVDLEIRVKERSTGTITLGAGYGSVQKFFLSTQISEINLFGKGQNLSLQGNYSGDRQTRSLNLSFTDPYAFDTDWSLGGDLYLTNFRVPDTYVLRRKGVGARTGYPITDDINFFVNYRLEEVKVSDVVDTTIDTSLDEGDLSSITWSMVRDVRNNRFETSKGDYQKISLEVAGIGGDKNFAKWTLNNRYYTSVVGDLILRNNFTYGQIAKTKDRDTPPSERFYLGGPNDLRGFPFFDVGPTELLPSGVRRKLGGQVQMYANVEFEYPLIREAGLKIVTFIDTGNAWASFPGTNGESFKLFTNWGFGFRWFSPIGPLRFEWGIPFNKADGSGTQFQFFIGPPF